MSVDNGAGTITLHGRRFDVFIPHETIQSHIDEIARRINADYGGGEDVPLFVGVLNGSFMFFAELMQRIEFPCEVSFVKLASYEGTESSGCVRQLIGLREDISGRRVIVVEDVVDTGCSIAYTVGLLREMRPASVDVAALLFKPASYSRDIPIRYRAMEVGNEFIVGFGLDYDGLGRNLKHIYKICE